MTPIGETVRDFYLGLHRVAQEYYRANPTKEHPPTLDILMSDDSHDLVMLHGLMTDEYGGARAATLQQRCMTFRQGEVYVRCAALVNEAWMRRLAPGQERGHLRNEMHADRLECLLFNLLTEHKQAIITCRIDRQASGTTLEQKRFEWLPDGKDPVRGRFAGNMVRG